MDIEPVLKSFEGFGKLILKPTQEILDFLAWAPDKCLPEKLTREEMAEFDRIKDIRRRCEAELKSRAVAPYL